MSLYTIRLDAGSNSPPGYLNVSSQIATPYNIHIDYCLYTALVSSSVKFQLQYKIKTNETEHQLHHGLREYKNTQYYMSSPINFSRWQLVTQHGL